MSAGLLACPRCRHALSVSPGELRCAGCGAAYRVEEGVPDLLPWAGGAPGPEWDRWREKLERLRAWRAGTWDGSVTSAARQREADDVAAAFFVFARIPEGATVLEIGCGAGDLKRFLPGRTYLGIDPMPVPGIPLVRGVGERLPVVEGAFDAVLVCETLDHALEPARVLREARRALRPGGLLALLQSVHVAAPPPPLALRLRVAAGRLKGRLAGTLAPDDEDTKMHAFDPPALRALVSEAFAVEEAVVRGGSLFLRGRASP